MRAQTREAIQKALFEAFFVVLAVALALAANEWRQGRAERRQASAALASIVGELDSNRAAVRESYDYHSDLLARIRAHQRDGSAPDVREFPRGFISPARVFQTAWDTAAATGGLAHMEYATVLELSRLYARQRRYEVQEQAMGEIIYGELYRDGIGGLLGNYANLATIIATFSYREKELLDYYDQTLAALAGQAAAGSEPADGPGSGEG